MAANDIQAETETGATADRSRQKSPVRRQMQSARRVVGWLTMLVLPVVLLAVIGIGVVYVRLANGPVSLSYLKPAIERQIADKLGGLKVTVSDVVLSLVGRRAEFRLTDVQVRDETNAIVAQAPLASMEIDRGALFQGRVSPTGIVLIRPLMRLAYSEAKGLSLSFASSAPQSVAGEKNKGASASAVPERRNDAAVQRDRNVVGNDIGSITVLRSIAGLLGKMRLSDDGGRSLDKIGVRNALIEFDYLGRKSRWGLPSGDIDISHSADRSVVTGFTTLVEAEGENVLLAFHAEQSTHTRQISLRTTVRDLKPSALKRIAPVFDGLDRLNAAVSAESLFKLDEQGEIIDGTVTLEVGAGTINMDYGLAPLRLDHGRIALKLREGSRVIAVEPSTLSWGNGNELVFAGLLSPEVEDDFAGAWRFDLKGQRGHFVDGGGTRQPLQGWSMVGSAQPTDRQLRFDAIKVLVAGGSVTLKGEVNGIGLVPLRLEGEIGAGPVGALAYLWPIGLAQDGRDWMRANIIDGTLTGGRFALVWSNDQSKKADAASQSLILRGRDLKLESPFGKSPIFAAKALMRITGDRLQVDVPSVAVRADKSRPLILKQLSFDAPALSIAAPTGQLEFKVAGRLKDAAAIVSAAPRSTKVLGGAFNKIRSKASGKVEGKLRITLPLHDRSGEVPVVTGQVAIKDVRAKDVIGRHDLSGGAFNLNMAAKSINADGEMLIAGVASKMVWQYILDAPLESQPPLRLSTSLDEADRDKLGIKVNHILRGIVDVEINLIPLASGEFGSKVRVNATQSEIAVQSLAWVKPPGRQTLLEFDVVPGKQHPVLLDNLRVVGDGIAIQGRAMLDKDYSLQSFELPQFSIDRVTRLRIRGNLNKGEIWRVNVGGQTFEGRPLFRSLFQAGRTGNVAAVSGAKQMGIDLEAEISTVLGFWNSKLTNVRMSLSKRRGKIQSMKLEGRLANEKLLRAAIVRGAKQRREFQAFSDDAGKAFALVGFYPNAHRGRLELVVNLDAQGAADKSGVLLVRNFSILNDQVVGELASAPRGGIQRRQAGGSRRDVRGNQIQALKFDWMRLPFFIGNGQFILQGAELRGPVVGATIEGKADFKTKQLDLSGTYVPLQGLNGALGVIPGIGQILAGPNGEGVLGMKFAVRGPMAQPEMLVNPLSMMAPGIFREMFQIANPSLGEIKPSGGSGKRAADSEKRNGWRNGAFSQSN